MMEEERLTYVVVGRALLAAYLHPGCRKTRQLIQFIRPWILSTRVHAPASV